VPGITSDAKYKLG